VYPFLDQLDFRNRALGPNIRELLKANPAFSALYHTVLALGCQYHEGGTWELGKGEAWKLFQVALGLIADILLPREHYNRASGKLFWLKDSSNKMLTSEKGSCGYGRLALSA
jgi:hypothetical protein